MGDTPNHFGVVPFVHPVKGTFDLKLTFQVISEIQQLYGLEEWDERIRSGLEKADIGALAEFMALCAGISAEEAQELCIPMMPARVALLKTWQIGMTGNVKDDSPGKGNALMTWLVQHLKPALPLASDGQNSGS